MKSLADYVFDKNQEQDRELASLKEQNDKLLNILTQQQSLIEQMNQKLQQLENSKAQ